MALRGVKPEAIQKRLKAFFYGEAGAGKTTCAISFPKPYLIETEGGAENDAYIKRLQDSGALVYCTSDFDEVMDEIKSLMSDDHAYKTLVIDPLTHVYDGLVEKCGADKKIGTEFGRHYSEANRRFKQMMKLLARLDMNVIITSHAKKEYGDNMVVKGITFDCYKKLDYLFDLVVEVQMRGDQRVGIVKKTRIESFPYSEVFPFSYEEIARRYGSDVLERKAVAANLATDEQVMSIKHLVSVLKIDQSTITKILQKEDVDDFSYLSSAYLQKCIDKLKLKIQGEAA
jgi:hypothetical protein